MLNPQLATPSAPLQQFCHDFQGRTLFSAESTGRREILQQMLQQAGLTPTPVEGWQAFLNHTSRHCLTVAALDEGFIDTHNQFAFITESQLYGQQVMQRRRRRQTHRHQESVIRNLAELQLGSAVVHEDHGVGRYRGLKSMELGGTLQEFLQLEYAGGDTLYVPVTALDLIHRYSGASAETAPLHKLGSGLWERAKRKAKERVRDVAAELLAIYAKRAAQQGFIYQPAEQEYHKFAAEFPFEETPDQLDAIEAVISDMALPRPMDRVICGDVGFGKTEVAMRAAFIAVQAGRQVAVLVPTTLLSEQHLQNFRDRFANWPVNIAALSRFRSGKESRQVVAELASGQLDIVIGTHKLLQKGIEYHNLGLVIIDEEHRFGVRQKEQFKQLRAEVDLLTLTATPIPRTLNMALGGIRDLSIIASPPAKRLAVKTFVHDWSDSLIFEACQRELRRGGQIYFIHNEIETIEKISQRLEGLLPDARIATAHGQMRERDLEQVMSDFYHQRYNLLLCTTIIETGIDIPSANTIIINRADRFGLAQLYQLRGRVGRSHHRAYAYLLVNNCQSLTKDAQKRLEAIESIEELGTGFTLATHDLEIRGAGELLGDDQSGQMHEVGFTLYAELLERAVKALQQHGDGGSAEEESESPKIEIELGLPALLPESYITDVHTRLVLYKRIASQSDQAGLDELQAELIDRFGLLPEPAKRLFTLMQLKQQLYPLGIRRLEMGEKFGRITFIDHPPFDPIKMIQLLQAEPQRFQLDPQQRLKINQPMPEEAQRLEVIAQLIRALQT